MLRGTFVVGGNGEWGCSVQGYGPVPYNVGVSKHMVRSSQTLAEEEEYVVASTVVYSVYVVYEVVSFGVLGVVVKKVEKPVKEVMLKLPVDVVVP
jgi:hypothetical protein